jgi:phosphatidylinositol phospholipase C delta
MSSFSETKAAALIQNNLHQYQEFNLKHMSRIYPKGTRADSSNYKPNPYWSAGCQMGKSFPEVMTQILEIAFEIPSL